ncbi:MAG: FAD-binding oxidoreductase [Dehalococcoidia bacterium]|nr:FAD-binding oxidoreductase [Dehalococcoidia bacterium]
MHLVHEEQPLPSEADVVIIGGGIVGCAAAYDLARAGVSVALLEKGAIANEQSSRNWGWVRQNGRRLVEVPMAVASRQIWEQFARDLGEDIGWAQDGNIDVAYTHDEMALFRDWGRRAADLGLSTQVLAPGEVAEFVPGITGSIVGGNYSPTDGQADPHRAPAAISRAAAREGATVVENCAVERIARRNGRVAGVVTDRGTIRAGTVIVAAGAWSTRLLWKLGLRLPQRPIRNTVVATTPTQPVTRLVVWADGVSLRQDDTNRWILSGGGRSDHDLGVDTARFFRSFAGGLWDARRRGDAAINFTRDTFYDGATILPRTPGYRHPWKVVRNREPEPNLRNAWETFQNFRHTLPDIGPIGIERTWSGYIDYTPDAVPVLDAPGDPDGLVIASGFSGHGFAMGPMGGRLAAELAQGRTPSLDLHPFRLARFAEGDTHEHDLHF